MKKVLILIAVCLISACNNPAGNNAKNTNVNIVKLQDKENIFSAIESQDLQKIKQSIKNGANLNEKNWQRLQSFESVDYTPLGYAIGFKKEKNSALIVNELIKAGANVNEVINYEYDYDMDEEADEVVPHLPLSLALEEKVPGDINKDIVEELLKAGAKVDDEIIIADPEIAQILSKYSIKYTLKDKKAVNAHELFKAIRNNNLEQVKTLIKNGADVNNTRYQSCCCGKICGYEYSALTDATIYGNLEIVKELLKSGAKPNQENIDEDDYIHPLPEACERGYLEIVKELLMAGANVNAKNSDGKTALIVASAQGHTDIVKTLIGAGAKVNTPGYDGETALMFASAHGYTEIVKALISAGAKVNTPGYEGETALMFASGKGYTEIVKALISAGADVNTKSNYGKTALEIAKEKNNTEIVELLKQAGAKE